MGIAINFVHDQKTWQDMRAMEEALGMNISCIETKDFDIMEEVRVIVVTTVPILKFDYVDA